MMMAMVMGWWNVYSIHAAVEPVAPHPLVFGFWMLGLLPSWECSRGFAGRAGGGLHSAGKRK